MPSEGTKVIKIRIPDEDFQTLDQICKQSGNMTVGDLARSEMHHLVNTLEATTLTGSDVRLWFRELISRLASLQDEIERLERLLKVKR